MFKKHVDQPEGHVVALHVDIEGVQKVSVVDERDHKNTDNEHVEHVDDHHLETVLVLPVAQLVAADGDDLLRLILVELDESLSEHDFSALDVCVGV